MNRTHISLLIIIFLNIKFYNSFATSISQKDGEINGNFILDSSWEQTAYLSHIKDFDAMYSMSNEMILDQSNIDSDGKFKFDLKFLPEKDNLYRIHFVKKGDPPASIIIGGKDENHFFVIANNKSQITVRNLTDTALIYGITFSDSCINNSFLLVKQVSNYIDSSYHETQLKKEFIKNAFYEKYRFIADTSTHPLISLYSIYLSKFESNYQQHENFYNAYLKKWKNNNSQYFKTFRNQIPLKTKNYKLRALILIFTFFSSGFLLGKYRNPHKKRTKRLNGLSIQERKIFYLVTEGKTNQEISDVCNIGISTVKSHVSSIYSKLKIKSRKEAINIHS